MARSILREERVTFRRPTNVSLDAATIDDAKQLGINVSRACEDGLNAAIRAEKNRRWQEENREATDAYNEYIEKYGLPLARYRQF